MKRVLGIFLLLLLALATFLFLGSDSVLAGCDIAFCTPSDCLQSRCNTCDFCLQCDVAFCTPSDCTNSRCLGCDFCDPVMCDVAFCTPSDCSNNRCRDCDFCINPSGTFSCYWAGTSAGCVPANVNCGTGYEVDLDYCRGFSYSGCNNASATNCIFKSTPSVCPATRPYNYCTLPSHPPNATCINEGVSAHCGGMASHMVLWCCSDDTFNPPPGLGGGGPDIVNCPSGGKGIVTAIGCIPLEDTNAFVKFLLRWGLGIGGGVAFLLIVLAGFQIITSSGDPKRLQAGKELLTSAIAGLLLVIFSAFILRLIGVEILKIPGFGT